MTATLPSAIFTRAELLDAYRTMKTIRVFEDRIHDEFATGLIPGFVHLYAGEEASATGTCMHLTDLDYISSTHRGHGHCIAKGCDVKGMMLEIYGKRDGLCKGKGGSMHIADFNKGMMGANSIVGAGVPLAVGAALAAKTLKSGRVAVAFCGDGGANQGGVLESLNLAAVWKLPVVFVFENNGYAETTASSWSVACGDIVNRASGFGMPGVKVDGFDFFAVHAAAGQAIQRARSGGGPTLVEVSMSRFYGHHEGDTQTYRGKSEVAQLKAQSDCIKLFTVKALAMGPVTSTDLEAVDREVARLIDESVSAALEAAIPHPDALYEDVYVSYQAQVGR
jgi:acetoin:2,6-dichlorophenolindophenol oxidoreductase subunit alpha